jgi:hypothetical protein
MPCARRRACTACRARGGGPAQHAVRVWSLELPSSDWLQCQLAVPPLTGYRLLLEGAAEAGSGCSELCDRTWGSATAGRTGGADGMGGKGLTPLHSIPAKASRQGRLGSATSSVAHVMAAASHTLACTQRPESCSHTAPCRFCMAGPLCVGTRLMAAPVFPSVQRCGRPQMPLPPRVAARLPPIQALGLTRDPAAPLPGVVAELKRRPRAAPSVRTC